MINKFNQLLDEWIEKNKEEVVSKWIKLAEIPSIKAEGVEGAPFGINCKKALDASVEMFRNKGFTSYLNDKSTYALCCYGDGEKKIGIFSHSDVVPVGEDWIYTEPFKPIVIDGTLIGRGVEDNKSGIMAAYCIFNFFKDNNIQLNNKLELFIGSDEECGMEDLKNYLSDEIQPDVSIVPDADFPCSVGEKGICHLMTESKSAFDSIIGIDGGEAYNIVLDKVKVYLPYNEKYLKEIEAITSKCDNVSLYSEENNIVMIVKGVAKHASIPEGSVNAALVAANILLNCSFISDNDKCILNGVKELLSCYYGKGLAIEHEDPVFGKTTCVNGLCKTIDGKLRLSFDIRYGDTVNSEELEITCGSNINKNGFVIIEKDNRPGFYIENNSLPSAFEEIYAKITGEQLKRVTMAGGTYARRLNNAFSVGTNIIDKNRKTPVFKMPEGHGGVHQCDECIDIEGFFLAAKVIMNYIFACDEYLGSK